MRNFAWEYPKAKPKTSWSTTADVVVSVVKNGKLIDGEQRYSVTFRFSPSAVNNLFGTNSNNIVFAVDRGTKVYFKPDENGYKLTKPRNSHRQFISAQTYAVKFWTANSGAYALQYDKDEQLLYIDLEKTEDEPWS